MNGVMARAEIERLDRYIRHVIPEGFERCGMPAIARTLREQPRIRDAESALLALEALAAIAIAHGGLAMRAMDVLGDLSSDARDRVYEEAQTPEQIMGSLR